MNTTRRRFLKSSATIAASPSLISSSFLFAESQKAKKPLKILFLGGTGFIGPHMVRKCLSQGHEVTLFNRGKRNTSLFPGLEKIKGNRDPKVDQGLKGLEGRKWDAIVDTSGYIPRHVDGSSSLLAKVAPHYLYISTMSVYVDYSKKGFNEDAPLATIEDPNVEKITGKTYGALKVLCEKMVQKNYPKNATILRPTYIIGPGDHTDRFIHYINRPLSGGRMAMPGKPTNPIEYVDVRDLAEHVVRSLETINPGIYNMVNKPMVANFGDFMNLSLELSKSKTEPVWMDREFLARQRKTMGTKFQDFPMWHDIDDPKEAAVGTVSQKKAVAHGFNNRPFKDTVIDTFSWWMNETDQRREKQREIITEEFELALLAAWDVEKKQSGNS